MIVKFAIGEVPPEHESAIAEEEKAYGAFLRIPIEKVLCMQSMLAKERYRLCRCFSPLLTTQDNYKRLTFKTVAFWEQVSSTYSVKYVVKVDDDSYVRLDRLPIALGQWAGMGSGESRFARHWLRQP